MELTTRMVIEEMQNTTEFAIQRLQELNDDLHCIEMMLTESAQEFLAPHFASVQALLASAIVGLEETDSINWGTGDDASAMCDCRDDVDYMCDWCAESDD